MIGRGLEYATYNQMVFEAWEYAYEKDMFRFFNQSIRSLRLSPKETHVAMVDSIIFYINLVINRKDVEESIEENCVETAKLIEDAIKNNIVKPTLSLSPLFNKTKSLSTGKRRKSRLAL